MVYPPVHISHVTAAGGIQMQCGHEYGFLNEGEDADATEPPKLTPLESKDLDPNHLDCERD